MGPHERTRGDAGVSATGRRTYDVFVGAGNAGSIVANEQIANERSVLVSEAGKGMALSVAAHCEYPCSSGPAPHSDLTVAAHALWVSDQPKPRLQVFLDTGTR